MLMVNLGEEQDRGIGLIMMFRIYCTEQGNIAIIIKTLSGVQSMKILNHYVVHSKLI